MQSHFWRLTFLVLMVMISSCSSKDKNAPEDKAGFGTANDPVPSIDDWREDTFAGKDPRQVWEQFAKAARADLSKPGADPSDIAAKASALGRDPKAVFQFMRDQVALEPYAGVLRGARGTLMAGAGNALDRALLAQELLKAAGIESRLIAGRLSDSQADSLLAHFSNRDPVPRVLAELVGTLDDSTLDAEAADLSAEVGVPESNVKDFLQHARMQADEFRVETDAHRATQFTFLNDRLQQGGVKGTVELQALSARLKERLREHYWLQVKESDGTWSDFDPAFADAKQDTVYGSSAVILPEVPKEKFHELEFELVYQTLVNGAPQNEVLITEKFASADALFEPLAFQIQPIDLSVDPNALTELDAKQKIDVLRKIKRYQGVLRAGSNVIGSRIFDLDGSIYDPTAGPSLGTAGGTFFGDAFGGGDEPLPPEFIELRVVMRLTGPDRQPMNQTRTLVKAEDVLAPTFAPPLLEWEMLLQPQWVSAEFVGFRALRQILGAGNALMEINSTSSDRAPPSPLLLLELALLRQSASAEILSKQVGVLAFLDEPMLTISGQRLSSIQESGGKITTARSFDIVENSVRYLPRDDESQTAAFNVALRQSVADCTIEDRLLRSTFPEMIVQSGATILDQASVEKRPVLLANARDIDELRSAGVSDTNIAWIHANESPAAQLVVARTSSGADAWWSVRADGNAVLRAYGGQGVAAGESSIMRVKIALNVLCFLSASSVLEVAHCVAALGVTASSVYLSHLLNATGTAFTWFSKFWMAAEALHLGEVLVGHH